MSAVVDQVREWAASNDYFRRSPCPAGKGYLHTVREKVATHSHWPGLHRLQKGEKNHTYFVNPGEERVQKGRVAVARADSGSADIDQVCRYLESQF